MTEFLLHLELLLLLLLEDSFLLLALLHFGLEGVLLCLFAEFLVLLQFFGVCFVLSDFLGKQFESVSELLETLLLDDVLALVADVGLVGESYVDDLEVVVETVQVLY